MSDDIQDQIMEEMTDAAIDLALNLTPEALCAMHFDARLIADHVTDAAESFFEMEAEGNEAWAEGFYEVDDDRLVRAIQDHLDRDATEPRPERAMTVIDARQTAPTAPPSVH